MEADRRRLLQVRPCYALAYRREAEQSARGSNAAVQQAQSSGLISLRVLAGAEAVRMARGPNGTRGAEKQKRKVTGLGGHDPLSLGCAGPRHLFTAFRRCAGSRGAGQSAKTRPSHDSDVCHDMWSPVISGRTGCQRATISPCVKRRPQAQWSGGAILLCVQSAAQSDSWRGGEGRGLASQAGHSWMPPMCVMGHGE